MKVTARHPNSEAERKKAHFSWFRWRPATRATRALRVDDQTSFSLTDIDQLDDSHSRCRTGALSAGDSQHENRSVQAREQIEAFDVGLADCRPSDLHGRLVNRRVDELRSHASFVRHQITTPISKLSALAPQPDEQFQEPLIITQDHVVIDGYARWETARLQGRETVRCIQYQLGEEEALQWLIRSHRRSNGLNDFARILLALDLEPWLRQRARSNQRTGGQQKGSSNLTEAHPLDVRTEIAAAAGVSTGNVTKVKHLIKSAHPDVLYAVRIGDISIHRAWLWSKNSQPEQRSRLMLYQGEIGVRRTIRQLVSGHGQEKARPVLGLEELVHFLGTLDDARMPPITINVVDTPGKSIFLTDELFRLLSSQREFPL